MRLGILFSALSLSIVFCTTVNREDGELRATPTEPPLPVVRIDEEHNTSLRPDAPEYEILPGPGLELDVFEFECEFLQLRGIGSPNWILLALGVDRLYGVPWEPGTDDYILTEQTLVALPGSMPFEGLPPGQYAILIGYDDVVGETGDVDNFIGCGWTIDVGWD